jgi:hypothetical protein
MKERARAFNISIVFFKDSGPPSPVNKVGAIPDEIFAVTVCTVDDIPDKYASDCQGL